MHLIIIPENSLADTVSNSRAYRISDDKIVIYYNLESDVESGISVELSTDGDDWSRIDPAKLSGDIGNSIPKGTNRRIIWDISDNPSSIPEKFSIRVTTNGRAVAPDFADEDKRTINAVPASSEMKLDGVLDESAWKNAAPATDFIQRELVEGDPATEKTEVRILFDDDNLYIGIICHDSDPDNIVRNAMSRDGQLRNDDNFAVVLDTFHDYRFAYYFRTNPNGARYDGTITIGGYHVDEDWNGLWDAAAKVTDDGWTAEMFIPFKTMRFPRDEIQEWGINFSRDIPRKQEETLWSAWGRDDGIMQLSKTGVLSGLSNIKRGRQVQFKPFALVGLEWDKREDEEEPRGENHDDIGKYGLDIKYPVTSELTLDLTTFTDFAQVESDRTRINLTRFSLYYPEKRDFFLEGAEIFTFASRYTTPFYSRRIGLNDDGDQIPILGGAKLTGKAGNYNIGVINMQTDGKYGEPTTNYSVVRVKKDMFERSYIGFIGTNRLDKNHDSQTYGVDFNFNTDKFLNNKNFGVEGYVAENNAPGVNHGTRAGRFSIRYPNDIIYMRLLHHIVGENYDPEVGFVRRGGIKQYSAQLRYSPRPGIPFIRQLEFTPIDIGLYNDMNDRLLSRSIEFTPFGFDTTTGERFSFNIEQTYEYLDEAFDIFDDVIVPVGTYTWWASSVNFESNESRPVSVEATYDWGDFYSGERDEMELQINYNFNKHISFATDATYNSITFGDKSFATREYSGRVNLNVSPRLTSRTFVQYNNESEEINLNFRLHYIPKIGSDIYLVYNHLWNRDDTYDNYRWYRADSYRTLYYSGLTKIAYMVTF